MTNRKTSGRKPSPDADMPQLSQEEYWKSMERSFNPDFIERVKKQYDGAERLQMA